MESGYVYSDYIVDYTTFQTENQGKYDSLVKQTSAPPLNQNTRRQGEGGTLTTGRYILLGIYQFATSPLVGDHSYIVPEWGDQMINHPIRRRLDLIVLGALPM